MTGVSAVVYDIAVQEAEGDFMSEERRLRRRRTAVLLASFLLILDLSVSGYPWHL